jgi:hypothetical protein
MGGGYLPGQERAIRRQPGEQLLVAFRAWWLTDYCASTRPTDRGVYGRT